MPEPFPRASRQAGFTLIEMSVVLVIIALIIGGILVGQEMVHSAELNSVMRDVDRIKSGVASFRLKYNYLPGDMPNATTYWSGTANGNGDGNIDSQSSWIVNNESYRAWQHLSLAVMVPGDYTGTTNSLTDITTAAVPGLNVMANKLNGFYYIEKDADALHDGTRIGMWGGNPYLQALSAADAKEIDTKIDDSRPLTGQMGNHPASYNSNCYTSTDPTVADYSVSNGAIACWPQFWID